MSGGRAKTKQRQRALELVAEGFSHAEAARAVGVSKRSVTRWASGSTSAPPGVRIQLGPSSTPVTGSMPAPPKFTSRAWVNVDTLEIIGSALHPKADPNFQADTKTRDREIPGASILRVAFCATPERVAEVAAALAAGEIPPDDPDERTTPLLLFGLLHVEQNPLDLAKLLVMCGAPLGPAPIKLLVAEQRAKEAQP
jgi:Homeodomain-like domain-containing protein